MEITKAVYVISSPSVEGCPRADKPEYAFIGRSNVGKSSLINMLTRNAKLAKTSNARRARRNSSIHFLINNAFYIVDLPGYGFAKVSQTLAREVGEDDSRLPAAAHESCYGVCAHRQQA